MRTGWIPLFFPMYVSRNILPFSTGREKLQRSVFSVISQASSADPISNNVN